MSNVVQMVKPGGLWIYIGPGEGKGRTHKVLSSDAEGVVTWSEPFACVNGDGQSWLGPQQMFLANFQPA